MATTSRNSLGNAGPYRTGFFIEFRLAQQVVVDSVGLLVDLDADDLGAETVEHGNEVRRFVVAVGELVTATNR